MAKPTATGKPYLVIIDTQAGRQTQVWYEDHGRFVGTGGVKPLHKWPLPGSSFGALWKIADAIDHVTSIEFPDPSMLSNPFGDHHAA